MTTDIYMQQYVQTGAGSGVIISEDGYIVTNNHVIDGAEKITVTTKDGTAYEAKLVGTDSEDRRSPAEGRGHRPEGSGNG